MSTTIEPAGRGDLAAIATVLADALVDDPVYADILAPGGDRRVALRRFLGAYLRSTPPSRLVVDQVRDQTGALLGAAVWERSEVGRDSALLAQIPYAVRFLVALGPRGVLRAYRVQHALERFRPVEPHWYLMTCGVRTDAQGAGVGGDLLRHRLRQLDDESAAAYLESTTSDDRRLFDQLGFVPGALIQGLPTARPTAMFRTPARRARRTV